MENLVRTFNITETCIDKDNPWSGFLAEIAFKISSTTNRLKFYSPGQIVFFRDMIIPIKHKVDWGFIRLQGRRELINRISSKIVK